MEDISRESCDCKVFEFGSQASDFGKGGIYYEWDESGNQSFTENVVNVYIKMPLTWRQVYAAKPDQLRGELDEESADYSIGISWAVKHPENNHARHSWQLSGTKEKPTLTPSLNWIEHWHGYLRDGRLESC